MKEYIELKRRIVYRGDAYQAINDELIKVSAYAISSEYMRGVEDGMKRTLGVLAHRVKDAPAADVVEVRHGEWVDVPVEAPEYYERKHWIRCSICRHIAPFLRMEDTEERTNYCPSCGAKMDGGDNP